MFLRTAAIKGDAALIDLRLFKAKGFSAATIAMFMVNGISYSAQMRIGGPTLTTLCATFLGWRLGTTHSPDVLSAAFTAAFLLLCVFQAFLFAAAMRLPVHQAVKSNQAFKEA